MSRSLTSVFMTSRSGSSMVCAVLAEHGLSWRDPVQEIPLQLPAGGKPAYISYENKRMKEACRIACGRIWPRGEMVKPTEPMVQEFTNALRFLDVDFVKVGVEFHDLIQAWAAQAGWRINPIMVMRPANMVADSLTRRFHRNWDEGFDAALARYDTMSGLEGIRVNAPLLAGDDWKLSGIVRAVESTGRKFNEAALRRAVRPGAFTV